MLSPKCNTLVKHYCPCLFSKMYQVKNKTKFSYHSSSFSSNILYLKYTSKQLLGEYINWTHVQPVFIITNVVFRGFLKKWFPDRYFSRFQYLTGKQKRHFHFPCLHPRSNKTNNIFLGSGCPRYKCITNMLV